MFAVVAQEIAMYIAEHESVEATIIAAAELQEPISSESGPAATQMLKQTRGQEGPDG